MPYKEKEIEKMYYSISEVAQMFSVNASLIRFWEKEFKNLNPKKNKKGNRLFKKEDIELIRVIYHLVKERGYTLDGAKQQIAGGTSQVAEKIEIIDRLEKVKHFLLEIKKDL